MSLDTANTHAVKVIAVTGGKGGVGKTNVAVNLGIALSRTQRVMLFDADLGLANVDVLLGLQPRNTLEDVLAGRCELKDIVLDGPGDLKIIPASSGTQAMAQLPTAQQAGLMHAFGEFAGDIDVLIVDTAAGISDGVANFVRAAQDALLVVCDEPSSITDAYALIKVMHNNYGVDRFRVVANQVRNASEGKALYQRLVATTDRFLDVALHYEGEIPFDDSLRKAVRRQKALLELYPQCQASRAFEALAERVSAWPVPNGPGGHLEFFVEQLVERVG